MALLQTLLLSLHLLCMNVAAGAPLVCIWLEWRQRSKDAGAVPARQAADYLAGGAILAMLGGIGAGLCMGWLLWTSSYAELWTSRLGYKLFWGVLELAFSLVLQVGYWLWRRYGSGTGPAAAITKSVLLLLNATNLLYHFPPLFLIAGRVAASGTSGGEELRGRAFRQEMLLEEVPSLTVHFTLASLAVTGILLLGLALRLRRQGGSEEQVLPLAVWGGRWALLPSLLQLPVGLWVLASVSRTMQGRLMGQDALATCCFLGGLVAALWLMRELVPIALGEMQRGQLLRAMVGMVIVVILMTAAHQAAKQNISPPSGVATRPGLFQPSLFPRVSRHVPREHYPA